MVATRRAYTLEDARVAIQGLETRFEPKRSRFPAVLGMGDDEHTVEVPNRGIQWHYARPRGIGGPPQVVFNDKTAPRDGLKVVIERDPAQPEFYRVAELMIDIPGYLDPVDVPDGGGLKRHHQQHEFYSVGGGEDIVFVADRQILGCRVTASDPADLNVVIGWGYVQIGQAGVMTEAATIDLSSYVPESGYRWVIITVGDTGSPYGIGEFRVHAGDVHTDDRFAYWPMTPIDEWRLAAILLEAGDTAITDWPQDVNIIDLRFCGAMIGSEWDNTAIVAASGAQYTSINTACAVASTGDSQLVYVMAGQYLEDVVVPDGVSLVGTDSKQCLIIGSVTTAPNAGDLQIANLSIYNVGVSSDFMFGLRLCNPDNVQVERIDIYVENDGTGGCAAAWVEGVSGNRVTMFDVYAQSYGTGAYGYYQTGALTDVHLLSCLWNGELYDIYVRGTGETYLHACNYHVMTHDIDAEIYNVLGLLGDLDNVDETGAFDGAYLRYEGSTAQWIASTGGGVSIHNDLGGLQGGVGDERYHLTNVQHTAVTAMVIAGVQALTAAEVDQLENIGATVIGAAQWGHVGAMDQDVATTDHVRVARFGVGAAPPNQDGAIALAETANPGNVAGVGMFYTKNDGGITKAYLRRDDGDVMEVAHILDGVTKTVGAAGDFVTVQEAVDFFKNALLVGGCKISLIDEAYYDEAVVFEDLFLGSGGALELEGDTRGLVGSTYSDGSICNQNGIADGGTFNDANRCTVDTNIPLDEITVSGGTADPDFANAGIITGDKILIYDRSVPSIVVRTIASISPGGAGTNVIELTVALANALGDDGDSICLCPDRGIIRTTAGPCIYYNGARGVVFDGIYLESSTGADCHGLHVVNNGGCLIENCVSYVEDYGFYADGPWTWILVNALDIALSAWGGSRGFACGNGGAILAYYSAAVGCSFGGYVSSQHCFINAYTSLAIGCATYGYYAVGFSNMTVSFGTARHCGTGYYVSQKSFCGAGATNVNNNNNGANYNPAASGDPPSNIGSTMLWT